MVCKCFAIEEVLTRVLADQGRVFEPTGSAGAAAAPPERKRVAVGMPVAPARAARPVAETLSEPATPKAHKPKLDTLARIRRIQQTNTGIYLDNNATTMVAPEVVEAMLPYFTEHFGDRVGRTLKTARQQVQALLGAELDSEVVFTSCGTESDSTAILSALKAQPERREIITTAVEHPAVLSLCDYLEKDGYRIHRLPIDNKGRLNLHQYRALLSNRVAIVSAM